MTIQSSDNYFKYRSGKEAELWVDKEVDPLTLKKMQKMLKLIEKWLRKDRVEAEFKQKLGENLDHTI